jgi:hypothetical protein
MMTFSTGLIGERLQSKAACYAGRHVLCDTVEPGTSKIQDRELLRLVETPIAAWRTR